MSGLDGGGRCVLRVVAAEGVLPRPGTWPDDVPAVRQLLTEGLDLPPGVTFLVGENGSGKSTLVEAIAEAFGLDPEAGTKNTHSTTADDRSDLAGRITLVRAAGSSRWGFFLRAETMHGLMTRNDFSTRHAARPGDLHHMSHGESFLEVLHRRFSSDGFYVLDEPEAALSFGGTLQLMSTLHQMAQAGAQVLCATHSPVLASLPGATIVQVDQTGVHPVPWDDLELVHHWRSYLAAPERYLRHLLTPPPTPG